MNQNGKSKVEWLVLLIRWTSPIVPEGHVFGDSVRAMFFDHKKANGTFVGYLISLQTKNFQDHHFLHFEDSKNKTYEMKLKPITIDDQKSPCLYYLFKK